MSKFSNYIAIIAICILQNVLAVSSAHALVYQGETYEQFLQIGTTDANRSQLGYWYSANKFFTYDATGTNRPIGVDEVLSNEAGLDAGAIATAYLMGTTISRYGPVKTAVFDLAAADGASLLAGSLAVNGIFNLNAAGGQAGHIRVEGLFNLTGGRFFTESLITGPIYAQFYFENVTAVNSKDIKANNGTITFYRRGGGESEVPEPATMALLSSSLLGLAGVRRKRSR